MRRTVGWAFLALGAYLLGPAVVAGAERDSELWRHRNLGKAFYENPTTQAQAVEELRKALELAPESLRERLNYGLALLKAGKTEEGIAEVLKVQKADPKIPHTWFNLGVEYKKASDYERAIAQFQGFVALVPDEPVGHYNLGVLWSGDGKPEAALAQFERAAALDPRLAGPHFQLYNAYKKAGRADDAARELATFQAIKKGQAGAAVPEDLDWSFYAELYDPGAARLARDTLPAVAPQFARRPLAPAGSVDAKTAFLAVLDFDGDGRPDLLAGSSKGLRLWKDGATPVPVSGLEGVTGAVGVAVGDFDNDGFPDLCVLAPGPRLFHNEKGKFVELPGKLPASVAAGAFRTPVFLDYDHDYDVDLVLLGDSAALIRNNGDGTWSDETARFPFVHGQALAAAAVDAVADAPGVDLAVSYADRPGVVYRDRLTGRFEVEEVPALAAGARGLVAGDFDGDGWTDLAARGPAGTLLLQNRTETAGKGEGNARTGAWSLAPAPAGAGGTGARAPVAFADLENRGLEDLLVGSEIYFHEAPGTWKAERSGEAPLLASPLPPTAPLPGGRNPPAAPPHEAPGTSKGSTWKAPLSFHEAPGTSKAAGVAALAAADFDADGRLDLAVVGEDGSLAVLQNATSSPQHWLSVALTGVKNLKLAPFARVEVKAGASYQKRLYAGVPLHFGLGGHAEADTVRITWPNGLIQNEPRQPAGERRTYKEAQRLSGSCPMIFTWDGSGFRFITDILGVAPLGASSGDGEYFPVDHDESIQIPGEALQAVDGRFEVRITEELHEVSYLDQVQLVAVDHPAGTEIFTNDKFKAPPFPDFRLFGVRRRIYPVAATDDASAAARDVLPRLLARDNTYPDGFARDFTGVAARHTLTLDFGAAAPDGRAVLFLAGWVDWADGSTFLASAQAGGGGLLMPQLQVLDAAGQWQTVIEDMGIPSGKPKVIAVDLTGKFLSAARQVRIVTSVCVYWDEIFLSVEPGAPELTLTPLDPQTGDLHFRGFSTPSIDPARKQPEAFDYDHLLALPNWSPTPGLYTRYGEVAPLLTAADDRLVLLGSGDEVSLHFPASSLPSLPEGWRRDFLLKVDGWAKDADPNTAFSQTVEPLPFHAMSRYPYPVNERFPDDALHREYRRTFNTRPALRLLPSLRPLDRPSGVEQP